MTEARLFDDPAPSAVSPPIVREPTGLVGRPEPTVNTTLRTALLACSALALVATACGDDDTASASPVVADTWIREPAAGTTATAAYATITNDGDAAVTLVGASSPLTDAVELHETSVGEDGTMSMQEREDGFVIEAGASLQLEPGGAHVMLLDVDPADVTGEIELTFDFDGAEDVTVLASVEALPTGEDMAGGDMGDMDHEDMDSGDMDHEDMESGDMDSGDTSSDDVDSDTTDG